MAEVLLPLPSIECGSGLRRKKCGCSCSLLQLSAPPEHLGRRQRGKLGEAGAAFLSSEEPKLGTAAMEALRRYEGRVKNRAVSRVLKHAQDVELGFAFFEWATQRPGFKHTSSIYNQMLRLLCREKKLKLALRLVNLMQLQRVTLNRDTFLSVAALLGADSSGTAPGMGGGVDAFMRLRASGFQFNQFAHNCLLDAILGEEQGDLHLALATCGHMPALEPQHAAALLRECCRRGRTDAVAELLEQAGQRGVRLSAVTYTQCIQALGRAGLVDAAVAAFRSMDDAADTVAFSATMHWLCQAQRLDDARGLFEEMKSSARSPDVVVYNTLLAGYCKAGDVAAALSLFHSMREQHEECKPNAVSFYTLVMHLCKLSRPSDALEIFHQMRHAGFDADVNVYNTLIHCCCRLGMLRDARRLHRDMSAPNAFTYGVLISAHCRAGWVDEACAFMEQARRDACTLSTVCYNFILHALILSGNLAQACRIVKQCMKVESPSAPNLYTYNLLLGAHGKAGNLDTVWDFFSDMLAAGCAPDICTFNSILHAIRRSGTVEHLRRLVSQMDKLCVLPTLQMVNVVVVTFASAGKLDEALQYMDSHGGVLELSGYNTLLGALARATRFDEACKLFLAMPQFSIASCEFLFKALAAAGGRERDIEMVIAEASGSGSASEDDMYSCLVRVLSRAGRLHEASRYLETMQNNGYSLTSAAYGSLLSAFCKSNQVEDAMHLFQEAERCGVVLDVFSYSCLMDSLSKAGMPGTCLQVFHQMQTAGCMPDVVVYNVLISCLGKHRRVREAVELLDEMATKGVMPDCRTYNIIIDILCGCGKLDKAYAFFGVMRRRNHEPDVVTYNTMLNGLKLHERMDEACVLFEEMQRSKCLPDLMTYGTMIDGLVRAGRMEDAEEVHSSLLKTGLSTDVYIYNGLISGYCRCGEVSRAFDTVEEMRRSRIVPNHATYAILIIHLSRQGHTAKGVELLRQMLRQGHSPSIAIYNALIRSLSSSGQVEEAYALFQEMITKGLTPNTKTFSALPNIQSQV